MAKPAFKVNDKVKIVDKDSQFVNKAGVVKSASDTNASPPVGHTGKIWNVAIEGTTGLVKIDEAHMDHAP